MVKDSKDNFISPIEHIYFFHVACSKISDFIVTLFILQYASLCS